MPVRGERLSFAGASGAELAARLDLPDEEPRAYALFAHCFTCSKDVLAAKRIAGGLAASGFAVMRFDFTGLGSSEGEFASTNFSSNVGDLLSAVEYLRRNYAAPALLIGHSLGGAAILSAAPDVPEARAVVAIGAPSDAHHVVKNFSAKLDEIAAEGEAEVTLAGRPFKIRRQFIEDLAAQMVTERVAALRKPLMILHSPVDKTVGIENAAAIYAAARHPKSFVSLDTANHLLTDAEDAAYVSDVIAAWATRYLN
jgi:alpha-beta hydrolase superfamily lysophospholipase